MLQVQAQVLMLITVNLLISSVISRPQDQITANTLHLDKDKEAQITFSEDEREEQEYKYKYESSNGISRAETASFEQISLESGISDVRGYYSYVAPNGLRYTVTYIANEKGFQPKMHISNPNQLPVEANIDNTIKIDGIDDDRIGTKLLISLGGGNIG